MQIDNNSFPVHTFELHNPKVLIRSNQAESTKGKNVIIGEPRSEQVKKVVEKKSPEASSEISTLGGQEQKKGARSVQTSLTDRSKSSGKNSRNAKKKRPSFKQLLAKYEEKGATQKQKERPNQAKGTNPSSEHREQSASHIRQGNNAFAPYSFGGPIAPWFWSYSYYYTPMDYSRMYMHHILFNILLYIQVMVPLKDRLLLAIIWSKANLIATRRVRRT